MQSIHHFSRTLTNLNNINGELQSLAYLFKEIEESTETDASFIDSFVAAANDMISQAEALKTVVFDPSPEETGA